MIGLMFWLFVVHRDFSDHAESFWRARYVFFLSMSEDRKALPWSLVNAAKPKWRLKNRLLPLERYESVDRARNLALYGENTTKLDPTMLVMHFTVIPTAEAVIRSFNRPSNLSVGGKRFRSLVSVHYMVDVDGSVIKFAPENRITTGTYGVDHRALAIEMVAKNEEDLMSRPLQLLSAFHLANDLLKKYKLPVSRIFSHQEVAMGKLFLSDYTDLADNEYPYCYPESSFRYDPGPTVMAWCREFLLRERRQWSEHPAAK